MKRKISLVIALLVSFLLMFSPIAKAEETKFQITVTTSEPIELEVVKIPRDTNKADSLPQVKVKVQVVDNEPILPVSSECTMCPDGRAGRWITRLDGTQFCSPSCN